MPNQAHSGIKGDPWHTCEVCGRDFRLSQLDYQEGVLKCKDDFDKETVLGREKFLQERLEDATRQPDGQLDPKLVRRVNQDV